MPRQSKIFTVKTKPVFLMLVMVLFFFALSCVFAALCKADRYHSENDTTLDHVLMGKSYFEKGEFDKAIAEFNTAVEINPHSADAYHYRGKYYEDRGDSERALADYNRAIQADENYQLSYYFRALIYQKRGDLDGALADYNKIISIDPKQAHAYNNRGIVYDLQGEFYKAVSDFDRAIKLMPDLVNAHLNRGITHMSLKSYHQAMSDFDEELKIYPYSFAARHYKSMVSYFIKKKYNESWSELYMLRNKGYKVGPIFIEELKKASGRNE